MEINLNLMSDAAHLCSKVGRVWCNNPKKIKYTHKNTQPLRYKRDNEDAPANKKANNLSVLTKRALLTQRHRVGQNRTFSVAEESERQKVKPASLCSSPRLSLQAMEPAKC